MPRVKPEILAMFDEWVVSKLCDEFGFGFKQALETFLESQTRELLEDYETGLWGESPLMIYDIVRTELKTGSPYQSSYLLGDKYHASTTAR